jgi:hypothetical protein
MLSPSNSVQRLPRKYLENQCQVTSTPTRFRQLLDDSTALVGVAAQETASSNAHTHLAGDLRPGQAEGAQSRDSSGIHVDARPTEPLSLGLGRCLKC